MIFLGSLKFKTRRSSSFHYHSVIMESDGVSFFAHTKCDCSGELVKETFSFFSKEELDSFVSQFKRHRILFGDLGPRDLISEDECVKCGIHLLDDVVYCAKCLVQWDDIDREAKEKWLDELRNQPESSFTEWISDDHRRDRPTSGTGSLFSFNKEELKDLYSGETNKLFKEKMKRNPKSARDVYYLWAKNKR